MTLFPILFTSDIDWAPEWMIEELVKFLRINRIKATFFVTNESNILKSIEGGGDFEIGLHPNFYPKSSHGENVKEVFEYLLKLHPNATSMRTHGLYQSSSMFTEIINLFPSIKFDISLFMPNNFHLQPSKLSIGDKYINRIAYQWEDDVEMYIGLTDIVIPKEASYFCLDVHPVHFALNSITMSNYEEIKHTLNKPLNKMSKEEVEKYINKGFGVRTVIENFVKQIDVKRFDTVTNFFEKL